MPLFQRLRRWPAILLAAGAIAGCGPKLPPRVPVEGSVTLDGQPVAGASITFTPVEKGPAASAASDENGRFTLSTFKQGDGAVPGQHRITVVQVETTGPPEDEQGEGEEGETVFGVPRKYAHPETSGLEVEVHKEMGPVLLQLRSESSPGALPEP